MKYEYKELTRITGSRESVTLTLRTNMDSGESDLYLEKTISETYSTSKRDYAETLAKKLMGGGGRQSYSLEDLAK